MRFLEKSLLLCLGCAAVVNAHAAMTLSANGMGQVLLFPYYTVQAGQSTLVTLVNTTDRVKLLHLSFHEPFNGREALEATIHLGPHDSWVGAVFAADLNGPANLVTDDRSCFSTDTGAATLADGRHYFPFQADRYTDAFADGGPAGLNRTREGSIEVVELAQVPAASPRVIAATSANGTPACDRGAIVPGEAFDPPGGGVYGTFAIVDAAQGTVMAGQATAIEGFSVRPLVDAGAGRRYLAMGNTSANPADPVEALVAVGGRTISVKYTREHAVDAVSALLMTDTLYGDFIVEPESGADTDFAISAPTKRYYADPMLVGSADARRAPFNGRSEVADYVCAHFQRALFDREQRPVFVGIEVVGVPPAGYEYPSTLCYSTDVLRLNVRPLPLLPGESWLSPSHRGGRSHVLESRIARPLAGINGELDQSGFARLQLANDHSVRFLPAGVTGPALRGVPVIGFAATKYATSSQENILSNYTSAVPLRSQAACADASGQLADCP